MHYSVTKARELLTRFFSFQNNCSWSHDQLYPRIIWKTIKSKIFAILAAVDHMNKDDLKEIIKYLINFGVAGDKTNCNKWKHNMSIQND